MRKKSMQRMEIGISHVDIIRMRTTTYGGQKELLMASTISQFPTTNHVLHSNNGKQQLTSALVIFQHRLLVPLCCAFTTTPDTP